jgi:hypothetical protein
VSVYIDPQMPCLISRAWRWRTSCHMFADTLDELHAFATRIGLRREWFQNKPRPDGSSFPHYDLNEGRRAKAVAAGAVELDRRAAVEMWRAKGWSRRVAPAARQEVGHG